ncbi:MULTISPECIES: replication initiation protein, partial [Acinetobacter]
AYASKVQAGLANKLGADVGYSHLITKNPFHKDWRVTFWSEQAYTLDYLADFVELPKKLSKKQEVSGLGRNCTMFDTVRKWAYKAIRAHRGGIYTTWLDEVVKHCLSVNEAFLEPLPYSEVKATAKSIATYCWKKDAYCYQEFIDRQSRKGAKGGTASNSSNGGKARAMKYTEIREKAISLRRDGKSIREIADSLEVSKSAVANWVKQ